MTTPQEQFVLNHLKTNIGVSILDTDFHDAFQEAFDGRFTMNGQNRYYCREAYETLVAMRKAETLTKTLLPCKVCGETTYTDCFHLPGVNVKAYVPRHFTDDKAVSRDSARATVGEQKPRRRRATAQAVTPQPKPVASTITEATISDFDFGF